MAITSEQVKDIETLRSSIHTLINKGVEDEYLLATYNGMVRFLDKRLPNLRKQAEGKALVEESRTLVRQQRQALSRKKKTAAQAKASGSTQKAS